MGKHRPIRFKEPEIPENIKKILQDHIGRHSMATNTVKAILALIVFGGVLSTLAITPGLGFLASKLTHAKHNEKAQRYRRLWRAFYQLRNKKSIEFVGENAAGELTYKLTSNGNKEVRKFLIETLEIKAPKKWDHKWRVVIFDIPEKFKYKRRTFQEKLKEIGFYPLQKSTFIHPFTCDAEIEFLTNFLEISHYVETFTTQDMSNGRVMHHFKHMLINYFD